ncbi:MAG: MvdD family ATP-grasp ribosomal peptide maturase, partial [Nostoc sp.]
DSQALDKARYDWRKQGIALLQAWEPYTLPGDVEDKLLKLMAEFCLNYGALDIILTPDGRHVFLEVNPVGEFFWLERCPGLPISQAIAEVLNNSAN